MTIWFNSAYFRITLHALVNKNNNLKGVTTTNSLAMEQIGPHQVLGAASKGDLGTLKKVLTRINLDTVTDKYGATPIHYAARSGKADCIQWLIQVAGMSGTKAANNGATPVHDAAATGQLESLQWLIQEGGCDGNARDSSGATPLHLAARFGHLSVVAWLVESRICDPLGKARNGVTAVHLAAAKGSLQCLKWLTQYNTR